MKSNLRYWALISFLLFVPFLAPAFGADWYDSNWLKARSITIDQTDIDTADLTNYPLYVNITSLDVGTVTQADCDDIVFTNYQNTTKFSHEIENCDGTANWIEAWVRVPTVYNANNTQFFMYYDNAGASDQQNQYGTWRTEYNAVYHLNGTFANSANANNLLTNTGSSAVSDQYIGDSRSFDGVNDNLQSGAFTSLSSTKAFMSAWVYKSDNDGPTWATIAKNWGTSTSGQFHFGLDSTSEAVSIYIVESDGTSIGPNTDGSSLSAGTWNLMAWEADGSFLRLYRNGAEVGSADAYDGTLKTSFCSGEIWIGHKSANDCDSLATSNPGPWEGRIDEVRYYNTNISTEWIKADWECQRGAVDGNSCITVGDEGEEPAAGGSHSQSYTDTLAITDTLVFTGTGTQVYSDTLAITDTLVFTGEGSQSYTDTLAITDDLVFIYNDLNPDFAETLDLTDTYTQLCTGSCGAVATPNAIILSVNKSPFIMGVYSDATRMTCPDSIVGGVIYNTDDSNLNICIASGWILPNGTAT